MEIIATRTNGQASVTVDGQPLDWERSLELRNHSPTGVEWGYGGSGPSQLALALLCHVTGDDELSERQYQAFKWQVIAGIPGDDWRMDGDDVAEWSRQAELGKRHAVPVVPRDGAREGFSHGS